MYKQIRTLLLGALLVLGTALSSAEIVWRLHGQVAGIRSRAVRGLGK